MYCVESILVSPSSKTLTVGEGAFLSVTVYPTDALCQGVTFSSSNSTVATVNPTTGYVYAKKAGTATIHVYADDGYGAYGYCTVTVKNPVYVNGISITASGSTDGIMEIGDCIWLNATVYPTNATNKSVYWESSDPDIACVSYSNGDVTAYGNGTATIWACAADGSGVRESYTVMVGTAPCVTSVTVTPAARNMIVGDYGMLNVDVEPKNAVCREIVWSSSDPSVATVNPDTGLVYAKGVGTATIYATAADGYGALDYCTVTVKKRVYVSSIEITANGSTDGIMEIGDCIWLNATVYPTNATNKSVYWESSDPDIACVSYSNGDVTAYGNGTATIYAYADDGSGVSASYTVTVGTVPYVTSVSIDPHDLTLTVGDRTMMYADVQPRNAVCRELEWTSSDPGIATVNPDTGLIYANGVGTATVYATAADGSGVFDCCTVTVRERVYAEEIMISSDIGEGGRLEIGDMAHLSATVYPEDTSNKSVYWESSNPDVACVDYSDGGVRVFSEGYTVITAHAADGSGVSATYWLTVGESPCVAEIRIVPDECTLIEERHTMLKAEVYPPNAACCCVSWRSSDPGVATVNPDGLVFAKHEGTATIYATATDGSGVFGCCTVTVEKPQPVEEIVIDPGNTDLSKLNQGDKVYLWARTYPGNATDTTVYWESSDPAVVSVGECDGYLVARSAGTATVTAYACDGGGAMATCTVCVNLAVKDAAEEQSSSKAAGTTFADPVDVYSGAHLMTNTVLSLFGGQGLSLVVHYNSGHHVKGALGYGWRHSFEKHITLNCCEARIFNGPAVFTRYESECESCSIFHAVSPDKQGYVLTVDHSRPYPYMVDCNASRTECYNADGLLAKIIDHQGFETLIDYADSLITVTDGVTGKSLYLELDGSGKLCRVHDGCGREALLAYRDDLLISLGDANGNALTFTYDDEGRIKSGTDAEGVCYFENTYDEYGRVAKQKDAIPGSAKSFFSYDGRQRITINRNGKMSTRTYDENGLLIALTDENGNTRSYEYDSAYNITRDTDASGASVVKTYNSFRKPTSITDRNGNTTHLTYDTRGNVTKIRYPAVDGVTPTESFVYDSCNRLTKHTDLRGTVTTFTYDEHGMPATKKVGNRPATVYSFADGLLMSQTDPLGRETAYTYDACGRLTARIDADYGVTSYEYDAVGNLLRTVDAGGKCVTVTYDANHRKTSVTDQNGYTTAYSYNGNMQNDCITYPDGATVRYEFDGEDRPVRMYDRANGVTEMTYDDAGRLIAKTLPDGATVRYEYDTVGNLVKETNPRGGETVKTYDKNRNLLSVTDPAGNTTLYEYNALSKVKRTVNAVAGTTVYAYSAAGDLVSETDPLGQRRLYTYDAYGNRLTETDARGNVTAYTYDDCGNLLHVQDALGRVTAYTYDALNRPIAVQDAGGYTVRYGYDALGRRTSVTDARGGVFTTTYDGNGNVTRVTDAKGNTVSETTYNALNQPLTVTDAMGKTMTYTYTPLGGVATVTDPMNRRSEYSYNARGMNTAVKDPECNTATKAYDALGNVTCLAGPLGAETLYGYDEMGRKTSESTVSGGTVRYTYNGLNILKTRTNARGQRKEYFYDAKGRITGITSPEGAVSYTYDENGNVLTVRDGHGTVTRAYDALNRVVSYTDTYGKTVSYRYDAVGNLSSITYPDGTAVSYAYDGNRNLTRVTDWAGRVTAYTYDANNRVVGVEKPDGSVTAIKYDAKQRVVSSVERDACGDMLVGFEYTYDDLSRIILEKDIAKSTKICYTYDKTGKVTRSTRSTLDGGLLADDCYTYDAAGNLTSAPEACFAYDVRNRLTVCNGNAVEYDADGNMLANGELSCRYDSSNRLTSAGDHTYTYNAEDVRIASEVGGVITTYTYDTNCRLSRLLMKATGSTVTKYVYGRGLIGEETYGEFKTYHFDCRGSTVALTDLRSAVTDTFRYDTYGKLASRTGTSTVLFGYNGRDGVITDPNGLIYMRARYYSPAMKRFINADIVPGDIANAVTLNRFAYANGNPVSFIDPFGLSARPGGNEAYYQTAVLVTKFSDGGLPIVGHTVLYFRGAGGEWVSTEFNTEKGASGITEKKRKARIWFFDGSDGSSVDVSKFYNGSEFLENPSGLNYVVLTGNFDESVKLAKQYSGEDVDNVKEYGRYNFFFHNCADYTNRILDVADLDGMTTQMLSEGNALISIPLLTEVKLSVTREIDSLTQAASNAMIKASESLYSSSVVGDVAATVLNVAGNAIDSATNLVGDIVDVGNSGVGVIVDAAKNIAATATNAIYDAGITVKDAVVSLWNNWFQ